MKWSNVKLIFHREVRDQLRDRRTIFTIAVLPLLLYPLLGMSFLQVAQFMKEHPVKVWLIGAERLPEDPQLLADGQFSKLFCTEEEQRLIDLVINKAGHPNSDFDLSTWDGDQLEEHVKREIYAGKYDTVVFFPPDFADRLSAFRATLRDKDEDKESNESASEATVPKPIIFVNKASDKSNMAHRRVSQVLDKWHDAIVRQNLKASGVRATATRPFDVVNTDIAEEGSRRAAVWSKILPFVVLVWALTGAFYPAVDLCAGEKERGTLETLLSSPAERIEIVWGKLFTVMTFSAATSLLNLISMGLTGLFIISQFAGVGGGAGQALKIGPPPLASMGWLILALIPISALFSALSLAVASFARSTKEGQYYLMPLLLISLPLMMLPMLPAAELDFGTAIIPIAGMMFLLRTLIEGQYVDALRYCLPVVGVTLVCCYFAIRWAVSQFSNESVLFSDSERWDIGLWLRHVVRDRGDTPSFAEAILCGILLLMIRFFVGMVIPAPDSWTTLAVSTLVLQIALIATPVLLMTIILTRKPAETLLLRAPKLSVIPAAFLLAVFLHPLALLFAQAVEYVYPLSESARQQLSVIQTYLADAPSLWLIFGLIALTPAIIEEIAFRGFILSGLRIRGNKWTAIFISSLFFGAVHFILQQSIPAFVVGIVIGYIVIQSGSILTGMLFHFTYNALSVLLSFVVPKALAAYPALGLVYQPVDGGCVYHWYVMAIGGLLSVALLWWFRTLPHQWQGEERRQSAFDHRHAGAATK